LLNTSPSTANSRTDEQTSPNQPLSKEAQTDASEERWSARRNPPSSPVDRIETAGALSHSDGNQQRTPKRGNDDHDDSSSSSWKDQSDETSTSPSSARRHSAPQQPLAQQQQHHQPPTRSNSVGDIYEHWTGGFGLSPALQIPSALVLPHHRRMAQAALLHNINNNTGMQPIIDRTLDMSAVSGTPTSGVTMLSQQHHLSFHHDQQQQQSATLGFMTSSTPVSTPVLGLSASSSSSSFPTTIPSMVSQVHSNSTIPISSIVYPHHIPTTTLMHHPPAVYWKYQVVEWLEQEKLRCLRLGLFWGFNADSSRSHSRKTRRNAVPPLS
jgi:hypothetical protein